MHLGRHGALQHASAAVLSEVQAGHAAVPMWPRAQAQNSLRVRMHRAVALAIRHGAGMQPALCSACKWAQKIQRDQ